ncbi:hypothetical protein M23134_04161 [Microscilla marina ATCC 23134]|uniref:Uncharacterized protein n=1 Tax=Microscilla marina ATCC 23134 TaxID=313606 RepID=A1ZE20_MICM2|nr:hypothetical protein M23134_04161 [Microscilla marina ATCC 23134]
MFRPDASLNFLTVAMLRSQPSHRLAQHPLDVAISPQTKTSH